MEKPRCGMKDPRVEIKENSRKRRYVLQGTKWPFEDDPSVRYTTYFDFKSNLILKLITLIKSYLVTSNSLATYFRLIDKRILGDSSKLHNP